MHRQVRWQTSGFWFKLLLASPRLPSSGLPALPRNIPRSVLASFAFGSCSGAQLFDKEPQSIVTPSSAMLHSIYCTFGSPCWQADQRQVHNLLTSMKMSSRSWFGSGSEKSRAELEVQNKVSQLSGKGVAACNND